MISDFSKEQWSAVYRAAKDEFSTYCTRCLNLDMSRGKPSSLQLNVTEGLLQALQTNEDCYGEDGTDYRNYGILNGIPEARRFFAELFEVPAENVVVGGNSSLNMMYDSIVTAMLFGASLEPREKDPLDLPRARLRPPLCHLRKPWHRDDPRGNEG